MRSAPEPDSKSIRQITSGVKLPGRKIAGDWVEVQLPDGETGYLLDEVDDAHFPSLGHQIIHTAERYFGTSYEWGGKTALGFDCSGFVQTVYRLNGIQLPRDTSQQVEIGESVSEEELQIGDIVFFKEKDRVNHVGIACDAGSFIHCSGFVKRNSFIETDPDYNQQLLEKRAVSKRIIQDE